MPSQLQYVQAANVKQAARHSKEVEELLLELSKQHAAAQAALPQQGTFQQGRLQQGTSSEAERAFLDEEEGVPADGLTPQAPRLTTPVSPSRRPSTHPRGFHTPPERTPTPTHASLTGDHLQRGDSLQGKRGRSFSNSFSMSKHCPCVLCHMGLMSFCCCHAWSVSHRIQSLWRNIIMIIITN